MFLLRTMAYMLQERAIQEQNSALSKKVHMLLLSWIDYPNTIFISILGLDLLELKDNYWSVQTFSHAFCKQIKEKEKRMAEQAYWDQQNHAPNSPSFLLPQPLPFLNIG